MKTLLSLVSILFTVLLSVGCNNDDDNDTSGSSMMFSDSLIGDMGDSDSVVEFTKNGQTLEF